MKKGFDCVEMKNRIQQELREQRAGMTDEEIEVQMERELRTSSSTIAQLWRRIEKNNELANSSPAMSH